MRTKSWMMGWLAAAAVFALSACGGPITYTIKGSPKAPDLDATVVADVKKDASMTTLKIDAEHLAPPDRLGGGSVFVVWARDERGKPNRVGALKYNEKERKATLEGASVPATSFDILVTVEKDPSVEAPSGELVFVQHVN
jgi:hypothetical protein